MFCQNSIHLEDSTDLWWWCHEENSSQGVLQLFQTLPHPLNGEQGVLGQAIHKPKQGTNLNSSANIHGRPLCNFPQINKLRIKRVCTCRGGWQNPPFAHSFHPYNPSFLVKKSTPLVWQTLPDGPHYGYFPNPKTMLKGKLFELREEFIRRVRADNRSIAEKPFQWWRNGFGGGGYWMLFEHTAYIVQTTFPKYGFQFFWKFVIFYKKYFKQRANDMALKWGFGLHLTTNWTFILCPPLYRCACNFYVWKPKMKQQQQRTIHLISFS